MGKDVIIALDFPSAEETYRFLDQFTGRKPFVKIGMERRLPAAVEGLTTDDGPRPFLLAVTQLTSTSQETMTEELLIDRPIADVVVQYAKNAQAAGLEGVVCSPLEAGRIHEEVGADFQTITPGIRFAGDAVGDQARVTTPAKAREIGSDYIVVGRSITAAADPVAAYERAMADFVG